jgi:hypothetical protein
VTGTITNTFGSGILPFDFENRRRLLCINTIGYASMVSRSITTKSNFNFNVFSLRGDADMVSILTSSIHLLSFWGFLLGWIGRIATLSVKRGVFGIHE